MDDFFKKLLRFLTTEVTPIANRLDEEQSLFQETYRHFVQLGSLNLLIPKEQGGLGGGRKEWIDYNILMARYSGALLFLQAQHQFCMSRLKLVLPNASVETLFSSLAKSEKGVGLALQKQKGLLTVEKEGAGYRLTGKFLWATGFSYFSHLLVSFENEEELVYTLIPFEEMKSKGGTITISEKLETSVFNAVNSNTVALNQWFISEKDILAKQRVQPATLVEHPTIYNFVGVTQALLDLAIQGRYGSTAEVKERYDLLTQEWEEYRSHVFKGSSNPRTLRREGVELSEKCALLARISCGSAGILKSHPLGRLIRESWQYTVAGYSQEQVKAFLEPV